MAVFSRLDAGCWVYAPMGGTVGLDWRQAEVVMRNLRVPRAEWGRVCDALRVLATEALAKAD